MNPPQNRRKQGAKEPKASAPLKESSKIEKNIQRICAASLIQIGSKEQLFSFANLAPFFCAPKRVQIMNCKAILSNRAHPEYGQATVISDFLIWSGRAKTMP